MITEETRREANESIDREKRYEQVMSILKDKPMTAKEISVEMCRRGFIPNSERNFAAPRLTELTDKGVVEAIGKKTCDYTGKKVTVYSVVRKEN